jgi:hypothetical protein
MRIAVLGFIALAAAAQTFPEAEISNGVVTAKFYLPDAEKGYYRGTRFDWSGQIYSLKTLGHEYFGQWFEKYDPKLHDAIMGPVEEFGSVGYDEAKVGETFLRIGVGKLRKPEEKEYQRFKTYEIVDSGKWSMKTGKDRIEMIHAIDGYRYKKTIRLAKGQPEMMIEHSLKNTGKQTIRTWQYNHNFFVIDGKPTGPAASVKFPFELRPRRAFESDAAVVKGDTIHYSRELEKGQSAYAEFEGDRAYDVRIENREAGAGVQIKGDRPIAKIVYWSIRSTLCPEPYIDVVVEPGKEATWTYVYRFYSLDAGSK